MLGTLDLDLKIPALILSVLWYGGIALVAFRRRSAQSDDAEWLAVYGVSAALWSFIQFGTKLGWLAEPDAQVAHRVPLYAALVLGGLLLQLTRAFLRRNGPGWGWWGVFAGLVLGGLALEWNPLGWPAEFTLGPWTYSRDGLIAAWLMAGWAGMLGGAAFLTGQVLQRATQPMHRNRLMYWLPVVAASVVGDGFYFSERSVVGTTFLMLAAGVAAYATLTHHLPDVRLAARRALAYLGTAIALGGGFGIALSILNAALRAASEFSRVVGTTILALILAGLFPPVLRWVRRQVDQRLARADYDPARTVREYSASVNNLVDVGQLARVALGVIRDTLDARQGLLFLVDRKRDQQGEYFSLRSVGGGSEVTGTLAVDSVMADYLYKEYRPLLQYDVDLLPRFRGLDPAERAWWDGLNMDVYVPVYSKGTWIGLFALGAKTTGERYFNADLELLSTLADQTTVALENARLVDNLVTLNRTLREAYGALDRANQRLEHLDRAKSDFIAVLSHELRTPLGILLGYSQMLADDPDFKGQPGRQTMVDGLSKGAARLQEIIETMLDMAMIDNRTMKLYHRPVPLLPMLQAVTSQFMLALQQRRLALTLDPGLAALPRIEADTETLGKVFYHLVVNAIKYTPDGGAITLSGRPLPAGAPGLPEGGVELAVADTGIGIEPRHQELIFAKFYQTGEVGLHSTGKTKFKGGGPGLGLAIARGIVEAHGGQIRVESPGYDEIRCPGTTFYVALPLRQPQVVTLE